jgi:hypothetical protein
MDCWRSSKGKHISAEAEEDQIPARLDWDRRASPARAGCVCSKTMRLRDGGFRIQFPNGLVWRRAAPVRCCYSYIPRDIRLLHTHSGQACFSSPLALSTPCRSLCSTALCC